MDETQEWLDKQIDELSIKQKEYETRAFLLALKDVINEQQVRTDQYQGELDGRLWDHSNW